MRLLAAMIIATGLATMGLAKGERAGEFDYYVMALSWSPNWCALEGDARNADQCDPRHDFGWILHGLWPQFERGWPSYCQTNVRNPSRSETGAMSDIMASGGLAWHQWNKHGRCSGKAAQDYFALSREAYGLVQRPDVLRQLQRSVELPAKVVEAAFLEVNPDLTEDMITITCKRNHIQEARICLTKELQFRRCGPDVMRDCRSKRAIFESVR